MDIRKLMLFLLLMPLAISCGNKPETRAAMEKENFTTLRFPSLDSIMVTADFYDASSDAPLIILCHQARFSRGEYRETAPLMNQWGFSCLAIDQRSGAEVNGVKNETAAAAKKAGKPCEYLDAEKDIIASVDYAFGKWGRKIILVGSSYSAGLSLKIAKENEHVHAAVAFSPGEYYGKNLNLTETISGLEKPAFVTSSKAEAADAKKISAAVKGCTFFTPSGEGQHGSKAMWSANAGYEEYRTSLKGFLETLK